MNFIFCPKCGGKLEPEDKFCISCGARLSDFEGYNEEIIYGNPKGKKINIVDSSTRINGTISPPPFRKSQIDGMAQQRSRSQGKYQNKIRNEQNRKYSYNQKHSNYDFKDYNIGEQRYRLTSRKRTVMILVLVLMVILFFTVGGAYIVRNTILKNEPSTVNAMDNASSHSTQNTKVSEAQIQVETQIQTQIQTQTQEQLQIYPQSEMLSETPSSDKSKDANITSQPDVQEEPKVEEQSQENIVETSGLELSTENKPTLLENAIPESQENAQSQGDIYQLNHFVDGVVRNLPDGTCLVMQEEPDGAFLSIQYWNGDAIFVNRSFLENGYMLAYKDGEYGYVDAKYVSIPDNTLDQNPSFYGIWVSGSKNSDEAYAYADELNGMGYPAQVYVSTEWSNLNPELWWVVAAIQCQSEAEANEKLSWVQQICPDAYIKWSGDFIG